MKQRNSNDTIIDRLAIAMKRLKYIQNISDLLYLSLPQEYRWPSLGDSWRSSHHDR